MRSGGLEVESHSQGFGFSLGCSSAKHFHNSGLKSACEKESKLLLGIMEVVA